MNGAFCMFTGWKPVFMATIFQYSNIDIYFSVWSDSRKLIWIDIVVPVDPEDKILEG